MALTKQQKTEIQQTVKEELSKLLTEDLDKSDQVIDIMEALRQSLSKARKPAKPTESFHAGSSHVPSIVQELKAAKKKRVQFNNERYVRVIARAVEVLGSSEKALRWINAPVRSLGDQTPMSLLNTPEGVERVDDALGRIEHGVW